MFSSFKHENVAAMFFWLNRLLKIILKLPIIRIKLDGYPMLSPNLMGSTASPPIASYKSMDGCPAVRPIIIHLPNVSPKIWWVAFHQQIPSYLQLLKKIREQSQLSIHKPTRSPKLKMLEEFFNPTILLSYLHTSTFVIFVYHLII